MPSTVWKYQIDLFAFIDRPLIGKVYISYFSYTFLSKSHYFFPSTPLPPVNNTFFPPNNQTWFILKMICRELLKCLLLTNPCIVCCPEIQFQTESHWRQWEEEMQRLIWTHYISHHYHSERQRPWQWRWLQILWCYLRNCPFGKCLCCLKSKSSFSSMRLMGIVF